MSEANFLPTPREIERRKELLMWMELMGWSEKIQNAIMYDDNPDPEHVRILVYRHGPDHALDLIEAMNSDD